MWPIIGHEWAVELLTRAIANKKLSHAYLFIGPPQIGKETLAKAFAQAILCDGVGAPCGECRSCRLAHMDRHPDVHIIAPESDSIKIEAIRTLQHTISLSPIEGRYRVCLISQFDKASPSAANALLKTLEEPPSTVILLLTASRAEALLPTIVSRCQAISLRPLLTEQIVAALQEQGVDDGMSRLLGHLAQGRMGWAITAAQDRGVLEQREQVLESIDALARGSRTERFSWAEAQSRKPDSLPAALQILESWWRDLVLLTSASAVPITNVDREKTLREWASRYDVRTAKQALQAIRDTAWRIEHNANLRLALEVLTLDLPGEV